MPPIHPPEATGPWQKTSAPVCYAEPGGTWRLFLNFSNRLDGIVVKSKELIEKMRAKQKAHRNILDMEPGFLNKQ